MKRRRRRSGRVLGPSIRALVGSSPACVAYKKHAEYVREEFLKVCAIPKDYLIVNKK